VCRISRELLLSASKSEKGLRWLADTLIKCMGEYGVALDIVYVSKGHVDLSDFDRAERYDEDERSALWG